MAEPVVHVLGRPLIEGESIVDVRGGRQAGALALLCVFVGDRVASRRIEDELWEGRPVSDAAVRVTMNRLRSRFTAAGLVDPVRSERGGYRLDLDPSLVDIRRFETLVDQARSAHLDGRSPAVLALSKEALALWRGPAFEDLPDLPTAVSAAERCTGLRVDAIAYQAAAHLLDGDAELAALALDRLADEARFREDVAGLRMVAANALGRRDLALEHHRRIETFLDEEIGVAPGRQLSDLRFAIEAEDPERIDDAAGAFLPRARSTPAAGRTVQPPPSEPFVGRTAELETLEAAMVPASVSLVRGPSGVGKSRLVAELSRRAATRRQPVLRIACTRLEGGAERVLRSLIDADIDTSVLQEQLRSGSNLHDADLRRFQVHEAATVALDQAGATTVIVDDLQWLDESGARLLWWLIEGSPDASWLLVTRSSPLRAGARQLLDDLHATGRASVDLELEPLSDADLRHVARASETVDVSTVEAVLNDAGDEVRHLVELVGVAIEPVPIGSLDLEPGTDVDDLVDRIVGTGLVSTTSDGFRIARYGVGSAIVDRLTPGRLAELHGVAASTLARTQDPNWVVIARHLLAAGPAGTDRLETAIAPALNQLTAAAAYEDAATLALEFIAACGLPASSIDAVRSRMLAAEVLLTAGRIDEGLAVHEAVLPLARRLDDPTLLAAAVLARGAVDVAAASTPGRTDEALGLLSRLGPAAVSERVQLACWAAHHQLTAGRSGDDAEHLLDEAESWAADSGEPALRALVLGIRCQATGASRRTPREADEALARLRRWAELSRSIPTAAMVAIFDLDQAGRNGSIADHRAAIERLEETAERFPRPDLRWYAAAARSAAYLAEGDLDRGNESVVAAAQLGTQLRVSIAPEVEKLHQALILSARGLLPVVAPMFADDLKPEADPVELALAGYVALAVGDLDRTAEAARLLAKRDDFLSSAGAAWALVAHMSAELARAVGDVDLGRRLLDELHHRAGTGLTIFGIVLLGSTDRVLGLALIATGDVVGGRDLLARAVETDTAKGMTYWVDEAQRFLAEL